MHIYTKGLVIEHKAPQNSDSHQYIEFIIGKPGDHQNIDDLKNLTLQMTRFELQALRYDLYIYLSIFKICWVSDEVGEIIYQRKLKIVVFIC